jgi:hypothetical protein
MTGKRIMRYWRLKWGTSPFRILNGRLNFGKLTSCCEATTLLHARIEDVKFRLPLVSLALGKRFRLSSPNANMLCSHFVQGRGMAYTTAIEWTDATWNPVTGCTKISTGRDHCYAERFSERFRGTIGHAFENGFDLTLRPERLNQPSGLAPCIDAAARGL